MFEVKAVSQSVFFSRALTKLVLGLVGDRADRCSQVRVQSSKLQAYDDLPCKIVSFEEGITTDCRLETRGFVPRLILIPPSSTGCDGVHDVFTGDATARSRHVALYTAAHVSARVGSPERRDSSCYFLG